MANEFAELRFCTYGLAKTAGATDAVFRGILPERERVCPYIVVQSYAYISNISDTLLSINNTLYLARIMLHRVNGRVGGMRTSGLRLGARKCTRGAVRNNSEQSGCKR